MTRTMTRLLASPRTPIVSAAVMVVASLFAVVGIATDAQADRPSPAAAAAVEATRATVMHDWAGLVRVKAAGRMDDRSIETQARFMQRTVITTQAAPTDPRFVVLSDDQAPAGARLVVVQTITTGSVTDMAWLVRPVDGRWSPEPFTP